ncbi:MAG: hypothetical protein ACR2OE_15045 [Thermomicrobiales bacterium]
MTDLTLWNEYLQSVDKARAAWMAYQSNPSEGRLRAYANAFNAANSVLNDYRRTPATTQGERS